MANRKKIGICGKVILPLLLLAAVLGNCSTQSAISETSEPGSETSEPGSETPEPGSETPEPGSGTSEPGSETPQRKPLVVASTSIWADIISEAACGDELFEVETLIPAGVDPHGFEPSLQDRARLGQADLLVVNGLALEENLDDTLEDLEREGIPTLYLGEALDPAFLLSGGHDHDEQDEHGHDEDEDEHGHDDDEDEHGHDDDEDEHDEDEHGHDEDEHDEDEHGHDEGTDPHIWLDPVLVVETLGILEERLASLFPELFSDIATNPGACIRQYQAEVLQAHSEISELLSEIPPERRKMITNHHALGYFANRYNFEIIGYVRGTSTLTEASVAKAAELRELIRQYSLPAVFSEDTNVPRDTLDNLVESLPNVSVVELYTATLGPPGSGAETYLSMMRSDAMLIAEALGG